MDKHKKRRNSILKKPPANDDDTTGDVTNKIKRRISFSGKKSVKEFIAGEEEATIWGTSYEESAECLQANSTESGLVNVNEKRIVLRNRRVVVDTNGATKRRSKKKIHVAENDKENVFVQGPPPELAARIEAPLEPKPALVESQVEEANSLAVAELPNRGNIWSSTFDFINCSTAINKTITIENSLDVTLNENELQMLKFRIPVRETDVNPILSLSSFKDRSSPNILSNSIIMSEEDVNLLKMMRGKKAIKNADGQMDMVSTSVASNASEDKRHATQTLNMSLPDAKGSEGKTKATDVEGDEVISDRNCTLKDDFMDVAREPEAGDQKRATVYADQTMNVSQCEVQAKCLKRKTITKAVNMEEASLWMDKLAIAHANAIDSSSMHVISPMRKKPMHNATSNPMDITSVQSTSQGEPIRRQTIHFESVAVEESFIRNPAQANHEDATTPSRQNTDANGSDVTQMCHNISMELSVCEPIERESNTRMDDIADQKITSNRPTIYFVEQGLMDCTVKTSKRRESIHTPDDIIEDPPKAAKHTLVLHQQTIRNQTDMIEDSPKAINSIRSNVASRQTIYTSTDIMEEAPLTSFKQRNSIYIHSDILEDSPKVTKPIQMKNSESAPKCRQSIYTPADIIEDSVLIQASNDTPKEAPIQLGFSTAKDSGKKRESIYTAANIIEDSPKSSRTSETIKTNVLRLETIFTPTNIIQDSPQSSVSTLKRCANERQSTYTPADMDEDSPRPLQPSQGIKSYALQRKSIYTSSNMSEDSPKAMKPTQAFKINVPQRQSVYTPTDIDEASPEATKQTHAHKTNTLQRQSIYTPSDIIEDSPKSTAITPPEPAVSAPKVIIRHMNLQQGLSGDQAALRILKNKQAKMKPKLETKTDDSFMDVSVLDELTKTTNKINFHQLNEDMFRGEANAFAEERKERMSLFDRLEKKPAEELNFDLFMDEPNTIGCVMQPGKNSMKDYTMELSMGKTINNQRGRDIEYTMDLSLGKFVKSRETASCGQKTVEGPHESTNPLKAQVISNSNIAAVDVSIDLQLMSPCTDSKAQQHKRQTIHFLKDISLDESRILTQHEAVSQTSGQTKRQTIHFDQEMDMIESKAPRHEDTVYLSIADGSKLHSSKSIRQTMHCSENVEVEDQTPPLNRNSVVTKMKRQTIHFNQNYELEESRLESRTALSTGKVMRILNDDSTMDLSMNQSLYSPQSAMRQPVLNAQNLEQTFHVNAEQVTDKNQTNEDTMDLSTITPHKSSPQPNRQTIYVRKAIEFDESRYSMDTVDVSTVKIINHPRRQTIHCNEDLELEDTDTGYPSVRHISETSERRTLHYHNPLEKEDPNKEPMLPQTSRRQTTHFNQDLEVENISGQREALPPVSNSAKRQTFHYNQDIELKNVNDKQEASPPKASNKTIFINQDLEVEGINDQKAVPSPVCKADKRQTLHFSQDLEEKRKPESSKSSKRQTLFFNEDLEEEDMSQLQVIPQIPKTSKRQTLHFNQDLEVEDYTNEQISQTTKASQLFKNREERLFYETKRNTAENALIAFKPNQRTVHSQENNYLKESDQHTHDDSTMNISIAREPNLQYELPKALSMPRRLTILDDRPVDIEESPQKFVACKSSFSRTLNFNEIPTFNNKTHTQSSLSIQERAAAKASRHTTFTDDDSPLYYNSKSKGCETTAEIDRSLAEYLKAEAAATLFGNNSPNMSMDLVEDNQKDHQTVLNDLEDKFQSKSMCQTLHKPVNVFEESGMQPLLRQTRLDSDDMHPNHIELQTHSKTERNKKPTEQLSEKPFKSKETLTRKTIHFTNNNAVDESFFVDNLSKPSMSQNRKTQLFNDPNNPMSDMEETLSVNKGESPAIQTLKEILKESNMLFAQSEQLTPPTFDIKRSTIFFTDKDNSMDMITKPNESMECESPRGIVDPECTPTKSKLSKSRIPQLIDSAKKLQSIKKSMELIQQELPNLAYPPNQAEEVNSDRRANSLDVSFDNVLTDIRRRVTTFEPKNLQESFETVEIPRSVTVHKPTKLEQSFDTIEIPRRATTFQKNNTLYLEQNEANITNISQKSHYEFEDAPITISDVSTFFAQKPIPTSGETNETFSPNTTETLYNLDGNRFAKDDVMPKSSDSEDTTHNFDKFKKRYIELTCDSFALPDMMEDIEKTHLSLVNTLDEQSEVVNSVCPQLPAAIYPEIVAEIPPSPEALKPVSSVCRKCKRHRLSVTQNDTTIGSFMVEPLPKYKMDLVTLQELATKPRISDIANVWQQKMRESDSFNISDGSRTIALEDTEVEDFVRALDSARLLAAQQRQRKVIKRETSFVQRVRQEMQRRKSNWILNELLLADGILKFTHTHIRTFAISIRFTPKDPRGIEVNFDEIRLIPNVLHTCQWTSFDYALHYQLCVELPFDLRKLCPTSENLFQLLEHIEEVTQDVLKTGRDMLYLVLTSPASLIRDSSGILYIRKWARIKTPQNEVKRTEFQIEVRNIKKLSFESIVVPPLYEFDEKIQLLPVGQEFLRIFLADPMQYIKTQRESNSFV